MEYEMSSAQALHFNKTKIIYLTYKNKSTKHRISNIY